MSSVKTEPVHMDISEFRALGFIQEINRLFLHPAGLALEVTVAGDGTETISGVWDYRDDPEGIAFGSGMMDETKKTCVDRMREKKRVYREKTLGFHIQPCGEEADE